MQLLMGYWKLIPQSNNAASHGVVEPHVELNNAVSYRVVHAHILSSNAVSHAVVVAHATVE